MLEPIVENRQRTVRGNRTLIILRLLLATVALAILLLQETRTTRPSGIQRVFSTGGEVTALAFSPDGSHVYSASSDATARVWNSATGNPEGAALEGHGDVIRALCVSPDGQHLATVSDDQTLRIFDLAQGRLEATATQPGVGLRTVDWSNDNQRVLTAGLDGPLRVWDHRAQVVLQEGGTHTRLLIFAAYRPGDLEIVGVSRDGWLLVMKAADLSILTRIHTPHREVLCAAMSPDGKQLAIGGRFLTLWNLETRQLTRIAEGHDGSVTAASFSRNNERLLTGGSDCKLALWTLKGEAEPTFFGDHTEQVLSVALSPDGTRAVSGTLDKIAHTWDTRTALEGPPLIGHRTTLRSSFLHANARSKALHTELPLYLRPEGLVVIIVCGLTILYSLILKRPELSVRLAYVQIFVDVGLISALVYHTGVVNSPFVTLYLVSIASAAFVLSWRGAFLVAAIAATIFSLLTLAYGLGEIPASFRQNLSDAQVRKYLRMGLLDYIQLLLLPVCAFFLVAALAGNLSRRLAVARLLHREVLEGIGEGIVVTDLERRVLYHNQEIVKLLLVKGQLESRPIRDLLGDKLEAEATRVIQESTSRRIEITHRRTDGIIIPFEVRMIPVLDSDQCPRGLIIVLDDITAEKKMEEFFKHKERIDAMGQISATIAHEIRNPLASIRGAVQEIARSVEIPENKKVLIDIVLSESDRLDQMITDFLRYARMRPLRLQQVDIVHLLGDLRVLLISRPEAKNIDVRLEEEGETSSFLADPEQLRQVFLNLGLNALQAMEGCTACRVTLRVKSSTLHRAQDVDPKAVPGRMDRPGILVEIADTGRGIPAEVRAQMFEPFYSTKPTGTGLGLAIVDRIVQAHEGFVSVTSESEKGTTFYVWLPSDRMEMPKDESTGKPLAGIS